MTSRQRRLMTTSRIETLNDGVFAIALTLLVLNLKVPQLSDIAVATELPGTLRQLLAELLDYWQSFIVLAAFWISHHHQFHYIQGVNLWLLWLNIASLMLIVLVPFSAAFATTYEDHQLAVLFLDINFLLIILLYLLNWTYATAGHRLVKPELNARVINLFRGVHLLQLAFVGLAIVWTFFDPRSSSLPLLLIPLAPAIHHQVAKNLSG